MSSHGLKVLLAEEVKLKWNNRNKSQQIANKTSLHFVNISEQGLACA